MSQRSTSCYALLIVCDCVSWKSKNPRTVALSSTKAEYMAPLKATQRAVWLKAFLCELSEMYLDTPVITFKETQGSIGYQQLTRGQRR